MSKLGFLLSELRRRKVLGVAAAYLFVAWGVIEVSSTVIQMASAPAWIGKAILAIVAVGFPISVVLAWFFDLSSSGFVRTAALDTDQRARVLGAKFSASHIFAAAGVLVTAAMVMAFAVWLRPARSNEPEFTQITNFADAATAPALSPDGKLLAFIKGSGAFGNSAGPGQLFVKPLPDGQAVQLTNLLPGKATPMFTPDGTRITVTVGKPNFRWSTYIVSVNGGPVTELLPNASGLVWIDSTHVLFSEARGRGAHMGVRRATITRDSVRDIYWPRVEQGMAHRSAISPDRRWILIVEMENGVWLPCRVVPFDGSSRGRQVGPPDAQCTYAAWSPDGKWMYFSSSAGGGFHIWRQRFPKGEPEQLTHGPTEEEGIAVAPDGRSLITSAGVRHTSIWLRDPAGDRQMSVEEYAFAPMASLDGTRVYFLSRTGITPREHSIGKLVAVNVATGAREELLPGYALAHFQLSSDDSVIAFTSGNDNPAQRGIWIAPVNRSAAPRRVFDRYADRVYMDPGRNLYFLMEEGRYRFLHRLRAPDYRINERVYDNFVHFIFAISPDGDWVILGASPETEGEGGIQEIAVSTRGLPRRMICAYCGGGVGPGRILAPPLSWTRDGKTLLVSAQYVSQEYWMGPAKTLAIPVRPGAALPDLPPNGISSVQDYLKQPGVSSIDNKNVLPGATAEQLFYYDQTTIRNLYRLQLPN